MKRLGESMFEPIKCVFQLLQASEHYFTVLLRAVNLLLSLEI